MDESERRQLRAWAEGYRDVGFLQAKQVARLLDEFDRVSAENKALRRELRAAKELAELALSG